MRLKEVMGGVSITGPMIIDFLIDTSTQIYRNKAKHYKALARKLSSNNESLRSKIEEMKIAQPDKGGD